MKKFMLGFLTATFIGSTVAFATSNEEIKAFLNRTVSIEFNGVNRR